MLKGRRWELFECHRCGKCCIELGLPYDPEDLFRIAEFLDITAQQVIEKYYGQMTEDGKRWNSDDRKRKPCPFLIKSDSDEKSACSIYEVRPEGCRLYPFDTDFGRCNVDCPGAEIAYARLREEQLIEDY